MSYCHRCGAQLPRESRFCTACGVVIPGAEDQAAAVSSGRDTEPTLVSPAPDEAPTVVAPVAAATTPPPARSGSEASAVSPAGVGGGQGSSAPGIGGSAGSEAGGAAGGGTAGGTGGSAGSGSSNGPGGQGGGRRWLPAVIIAAVVVVFGGIAVAVWQLTDRDNGNATNATPTPTVTTGVPTPTETPTPSTSSTLPALQVAIMSPISGTNVLTGQPVTVDVELVPSDASATVRLLVDGEEDPSVETTGPLQFVWTPVQEMSFLLVAEASAGDDTVLSAPVTVAAHAPAPEGDSANDGLIPGPFWGAFFFASNTIGPARVQADNAEAAGFPVLVLNTADYLSIGKPGQAVWVVCAGPYDDRGGARAAALGLRELGYPGAYVKLVR